MFFATEGATTAGGMQVGGLPLPRLTEPECLQQARHADGDVSKQVYYPM